MNKDNSVIDIAMKYYYDTPDSFTKAFSIIGIPRVFSYDATGREINGFWQEVNTTEYGSTHFSNYGVSLDFEGEFGDQNYKYLVAPYT